MLKKASMLLVLSTSALAGNVSPLCQSSYYKGIANALLYQQYQNSVAIPHAKYWAVINVSQNSQAEIIALGLKLKSIGYTPIIVKANGKLYLVVYWGNDEGDVRSTTSSIPFLRVRIIQAPKQFSKVYFATACTGDTYEGKKGIEKLLTKALELAKKNLDAVEYAKFKKEIEKLMEIIKEANTPDKQKEVEDILQTLFGGQK